MKPGEEAELLELSADWLWETGPDHRFTWISPNLAELAGIEIEAILGRSRLDLLKQEARTSHIAARHLADLEAHRPFRDFIYELDPANAACRWVSISGHPRFDEEGRFLGYRGTGRNLTGVLASLENVAEAKVQLMRQRELEAALERAAHGESHAERLMAALNVMNDAFCYYDADDRLVLCNEAFKVMHSGLADLIGEGVRFEALLDAGLERGLFETGSMTPDEWRDWLIAERERRETSQAIVRMTDGRWLMRREMRTKDGGRMCIFTDITEMKAHEAELVIARKEAEAAQRRLQSAIDALDDGFVLWDRDDRLVACNKAFRRQFGDFPGLRIGRRFDEMLIEFARTGLVKAAAGREEEWVAEQVANRARELDQEIVFQTHDGRWMMRRDQLCETGDRVGLRVDISEMKRREAEIAETNEQLGAVLSDLQRTVEAMRMGVVVLDPELKAEIINQAFYDIWKLTPDQVAVGDPFRALMDANRKNGIYAVADEDWEAYVEHRLDEIRAGDVAEREFVRADGRTLLYAVKVLSGGKRLVTYYDISEIKRREAEIAEALERTRLAAAVLDGVRDPIFVKDSDLKFVFANKAFADIFGVTPESMYGKVGADFVSAEEAALFEESERRVLETGEPYEVEEDFEFRGAGHARIVRKNKVTTRKGKDYVAAFIFDISELRRRECEAQEARQRLADVIESLPAGVVIYDKDDRFVLANRPIQEALPAMKPAMQPGVPLKEALRLAHSAGYFRNSGDEAIDALYEKDPEAWVEAYAERYHVAHATFERKNGDGRWFQVFDSRTADGTFIGVRVDITELKQREAALMEAERKAVLADRAKSEFLANMSHEIRTPMNGVLGMAELLAKTELDARQKTFTDIIVKSGNALLTIINDILDFSKIDAGQLVLDPVPFNLVEAIEDVATLVSTRAKEKDLELIVRVAPELPQTIIGDAGRIRQIVTNLLGNAVKFTDSGHVLVEVSGTPKGKELRLRISVTDTGIGIPADKLAIIFEKFSQVDSSSTRRHEGTGLGLAITSRLVDLMGGQIGVESEEGKGSTFWFEITVPVSAEQRQRTVVPVDVTGARVLIIDDNAINRSILKEQMASWRFDACAAQSGAEGLQVLAAARRLGVAVDCVLLDYQMPGMNGIDVARAIRADPALAATPIVLLTSVDTAFSSARGSGIVLDAQLVKPTRSSVLLETLVECIQHRRAASSGGERLRPLMPTAEGDLLVRGGERQEGQEIIGSEPMPQAEAAPETASRIDILIAEDNEVNQLVFTQVLEDSGYDFAIVPNGQRALEAFTAMRPSMILMDVSMPEMNGFEATVAIRAQEADSGCHTPIIGVTAHALKGDRERCLEAGMDDYLSKPIRPDALMNKIAQWLDAGRQARRGVA
jgi:PAS domain S-box-containing protein